MRLRLGRLAHAACEQQVPISDRPKAGQVIDRTRRAPINSPASGIDVELRQRSKFLAVRVVHPNASIHLQIAYITGEFRFGAKKPAPAAVLPQDHAAYLPKR